ncbi:MAG: hypothetical protein IPJ71_18960 [Bdellovibrionales bacterium]|nr:hypothetical protein [Bdellovibrionales bacterium]
MMNIFSVLKPSSPKRMVAIAGLLLIVAAVKPPFLVRQERINGSLAQLRANGVLILKENSIFYDDGYILVITFEMGCSLIKMDGRTVSKIPGSYCNLLKDGRAISFLTHEEVGISKFTPFRKDWIVPAVVTHDVSVSPFEKSILYLSLDSRKKGKQYERIDIAVEMDEDGKEIFRWRDIDYLSEIEALINHPLNGPHKYKKGDGNTSHESIGFTHFNRIESIPKNSLMEYRSEFREGNILLSDAMSGLLLIVDRITRMPVKAYRVRSGHGVHSARWLENNNILIFVNADQIPVYQVLSYAIEIDPLSGDVVWNFTENPIGKMFCKHYGSVQRLKNGNTLISYGCTKSAIIEVDSWGDVVWKWKVPIGVSNTDEAIQIYRAEWLPKELVNQWLEKTN